MASQRNLETKYRISETAMTLFLNQGYESVTVDSVAAASQVSRRTVFRYFATKDELPFPDHSERIAELQRRLNDSAPDADAVESVIAATEESLRDFLRRPELVLSRYRLTRIVAELRSREVVEHERYVAVTTAYLRDRLPPDTPTFQPTALAALIDAIHRAVLGDWARSGGNTNAQNELEAGMDWVRGLVPDGSPHSDEQFLLAVLPDNPRVRRTIGGLRDAARETL